MSGNLNMYKLNCDLTQHLKKWQSDANTNVNMYVQYIGMDGRVPNKWQTTKHGTLSKYNLGAIA